MGSHAQVSYQHEDTEIMKILILNWRDPSHPLSGGAELITQKYAEFWSSSGAEVTWITNSFPHSEIETRQNQVRYIRVGPFLNGSFTRYFWGYPIFLLRTVLRARAEISNSPPDLIIDEVHGLPFFTPFWVKQPGARIVFLVCEVAGPIWKKMFPWPLSVLGVLLEQAVHKMYRDVETWAISSHTARNITQLVDKNVTVLPLGIDDIPKKVRLLLKKKKLDQPTGVFLARIVKMKGIETAIEALPSILKKLPEFTLHVVGTGDPGYLQQLQDDAEKLGVSKHIIWHGRVSELRKYQLLQAAHFLIHPSVKEGFGLTVLEAGLVGTPSLVRAGSSMDDLVTHGQNGYTFTSTQDLADRFVSAYTAGEYKKLSRSALETAQQWLWKNILPNSLEVTNVHHLKK